MHSMRRPLNQTMIELLPVTCKGSEKNGWVDVTYFGYVCMEGDYFCYTYYKKNMVDRVVCEKFWKGRWWVL